jgi:hypothetical protein
MYNKKKIIQDRKEAHVINIYIFLFLLKIASYIFLLNYIKKKIIEISIHVHDIMG